MLLTKASFSFVAGAPLARLLQNDQRMNPRKNDQGMTEMMRRSNFGAFVVVRFRIFLKNDLFS